MPKIFYGLGQNYRSPQQKGTATQCPAISDPIQGNHRETAASTVAGMCQYRTQDSLPGTHATPPLEKQPEIE